MSQDYSSALKLGAGIGVLAGVVLVGLSFVGFLPCCGCITGPVSWLVPAATGLAGGAIAAFRADWPAVAPDDRTTHGVQVGLRAGGMASLFAGLSFAILSFLTPLVSMTLNILLSGDMEGLIAALIASAAVMIVGFVVNLVIALVSVVIGLALGAAAGAGVAATQS